MAEPRWLSTKVSIIIYRNKENIEQFEGKAGSIYLLELINKEMNVDLRDILCAVDVYKRKYLKQAKASRKSVQKTVDKLKFGLFRPTKQQNTRISMR
jgi:hypothetical protein